MGKRKDEELADRLLEFTVRIIKLVTSLPRSEVGKHIGSQLLRSGTSPGANYEEARGAESNADFIHKLGIVLKELKETRFWIRVIKSVPLVNPDRTEILLDECEQLIAIIAKSIFTARKKKCQMIWPLGAGVTVAGAALFIVFLPVSLVSGNIQDSWYKLVVKPAEHTFKISLGEF